MSASVGERRAWAVRVLGSIDRLLGDLAGTVFEVHAGAAYRDFGLFDGLLHRGAEVVVPAFGLSQGRQLAFYAGTLDRASERPARLTARASTASTGERSGGYAPLTRWLDALEERTVTTGFGEIQVLLGRSLPASARRHRPWWANSGSSQARGWLSAGWRVAGVDLAAEQVTFERATT